MKRIQHAFLAFIFLLLIMAAGFLVWALNPARPTYRALSALQNATAIDDTWVFGDVTAEIALILYPGANVDARAYAAVADQIAKAGYLVIVPEITLNLAVFDGNRADEIIAAYPAVESWAIGGHSLGGVMAAQYVADNLNTIEGLLLWASYPAGNNNLSALDIAVTTVYGTNDGLTTVNEIDGSRLLLPDNTTFVPIEGGNHAQFGDYGEQARDGVPTITVDDQQSQIVDATVAFLSTISERISSLQDLRTHHTQRLAKVGHVALI